MRITHKVISMDIKENITLRTNRMQQAHKRMSEGKRLYVPSDDPGAVSRVLAIRTLLGDVADRRFQAEAGVSVLNAADSAINEADNVMQKATELAVASGGGLNEIDRNNIALQVEGLLTQLESAADTLYDDRPLFIEADNTTGATGFLGLGLAKEAVFGEAIAALKSLHADLKNGEAATDETLKTIRDGLDALLVYRTQIGVRTNRLEAMQRRLIELEQDLTKRRSIEEEVDIAQALIDLKEEEAAYQSALHATARVMSVSLVDFL